MPIALDERDTLIAFAQAAGIDSWETSTTESDRPHGTDTEREAHDSEYTCVTAIHLSHESLGGDDKLSTLLGLARLHTLDVSNNRLRGSIPGL